MKLFKASTLLLSIIFFASCAGQPEAQEEGDMSASTNNMSNSAEDITELVSVLHPTMGNSVNGVVRFFQTDEGVRVVAEINDLAPNSTHGFHIHQYGDCSALDGTSAGGHFNPQDTQHGGPDSEERHVGDLGNITVDENGFAELDKVDPMLSLNGPNGIIGRGIIVHAGEDDLESQPTGAAGARLSCGVIGVAQQ
jgi:Cu-Zn family superoxide dismutase